MSAPFLIACLVALRTEFDELAPTRDKESDGWIGDTAHQAEPSDHNPDETGNTPYEDADDLDEVHAIDVDSDLRKPGWSMQRVVDVIVDRHRTGADDRLNYVIYNRRIWASPDWAAREYTGSSPHTEHAHFSARYTTAQERDTSPWGLLEDDMPSADEIAQAVATKLFTDLRDPKSGLYGAHADRAEAGFVAALAKGNAASLGTAPAGDAGKPYRFIRDAMRAMVGGPVDQAAIVAAVGKLDAVDEQALAAALAPAVAAAVVALLPAGGDPVSQDEVTEAVHAAFRSAFAG